MSETSAFSPQDYSRFLIREFLKKNGFNQTYETFMAEDTRPKVTMTKNQLTALLGIEEMMKKNSKTKTFTTMLDIVCNFLCERKAQGDEGGEGGSKGKPKRPDDKHRHEKKQEPADKWGFDPPTAVPATTQQHFYGQPQTQPEPVAPVRPQTGVRPTQHKQDDDWDLDAFDKVGADSGVRANVPPPQHQTTANQRPRTAAYGGSAHGMPKRGTRKQVPKQKNAIQDNDVDELDDMMGLGTKNDFFGGDGRDDKEEKEERDPLDFLKKSEQARKEQEEKKKQKALEAIENFKLLQDIPHEHGGYDCGYEVDYEIGSMYSGMENSSATQKEISFQTEQDIMTIMFPDPRIGFLPSWKQGFYFDKKLKYGIFQNKGGPCGVLATVQAFFLKHLLFIARSNLSRVDVNKRDAYLAAALADIIFNVAQKNPDGTAVIVIPPQHPTSGIVQASKCKQIIQHGATWRSIYKCISQHLSLFTLKDGNGVVSLVYSCLLTKGARELVQEFDLETSKMMTEHGYATQEMINLMITGRATSNVIDGENDLGDGYVVKGLRERSEIGFLTLFEAYQHMEVGQHYKAPQLPVWIICSESHYSIMFSPDINLVRNPHLFHQFDLVYYDELARQEEDILLTCALGKYHGSNNLNEVSEIVPPIDAVIRTKWPTAVISWNGRERIL